MNANNNQTQHISFVLNIESEHLIITHSNTHIILHSLC